MFPSSISPTAHIHAIQMLFDEYNHFFTLSAICFQIFPPLRKALVKFIISFPASVNQGHLPTDSVWTERPRERTMERKRKKEDAERVRLCFSLCMLFLHSPYSVPSFFLFVSMFPTGQSWQRIEKEYSFDGICTVHFLHIDFISYCTNSQKKHRVIL